MGRFVRNSEVQGQWNGAGPRAKAVNKACARCGAGLTNARKTYCGPCAADRLAETIAANRHKYRKPKGSA